MLSVKKRKKKKEKKQWRRQICLYKLRGRPTDLFKKTNVIYTTERVADASNCAEIAITGPPYLCFFFLLFLCRSFALLTCDIGISASGTPIIINDNSDCRRLRGSSFAERASTWTVEIVIPVSIDDRLGRPEWRATSRVRHGGERSRHAGRYWRFVQVVRRPGRRRLQKHNHRRPDTDHWPKRPRVREEGL